MQLYHLFSGIFHFPLARPLAYLDPGTGSFLIQLLIAGLLGAGFLVKTFWSRISMFFSKKNQGIKRTAGSDSENPDPN
jgi:hypothetical protein